MWIAGAGACIVGVLYAPVPASMKVLALLPIVVALAMELAEEIQIARARVRAADARDTRLTIAYFDKIATLPDAEWEHVTRKPVKRQHRRLIPQQRQGGE